MIKAHKCRPAQNSFRLLSLQLEKNTALIWQAMSLSWVICSHIEIGLEHSFVLIVQSTLQTHCRWIRHETIHICLSLVKGHPITFNKFPLFVLFLDLSVLSGLATTTNSNHLWIFIFFCLSFTLHKSLQPTTKSRCRNPNPYSVLFYS